MLKNNKIKLCCYLNIFFCFPKIFGPFPFFLWLKVMIKHLPISKRHSFFPPPAGLFWQGLYHKAPRRRREDHPAQGTHAGTGTIFQVQKNIATLSGFISSQSKDQIQLIHSEAKDFWYRKSKCIQTKNKREVGKAIMTSHSPYRM